MNCIKLRCDNRCKLGWLFIEFPLNAVCLWCVGRVKLLECFWVTANFLLQAFPTVNVDMKCTIPLFAFRNGKLQCQALELGIVRSRRNNYIFRERWLETHCFFDLVPHLSFTENSSFRLQFALNTYDVVGFAISYPI